ncbi:hypothetical protein BGZ57DRAFT_983886 [Hyaloscypha finlandica]|nr:hypothetical protein BGZ57DRAFT_983886 [Hyaloscypha finlandica]
MVQTLHSQIEITLPPSEVKRLFLDFSSFPQFHTGFTARAMDASKSNPQPGDRLEINSNGTVLRPIVLENTTEHFYWQGNFHGLLKGTHMWRFLPSEEEGNQGGTTFVQAEDFEGVLSLLFSKWWPKWLGGMRRSIERDFGMFNRDFKRWAEGGRDRG